MIEHIISTLILDVAYLATGIALCIIGKGLLEKGISGRFLAEGEIESKKLRIATSSPGLVFLVCGLVIVIIGCIRVLRQKNAQSLARSR